MRRGPKCSAIPSHTGGGTRTTLLREPIGLATRVWSNTCAASRHLGACILLLCSFSADRVRDQLGVITKFFKGERAMTEDNRSPDKFHIDGISPASRGESTPTGS